MSRYCDAPSPVLLVDGAQPDCRFHDADVLSFAALSDTQLLGVDPVVLNLVVAKGLPALADLDVGHYQDVVNGWTADFSKRCLPRWEPFFHSAPEDFKNDIRYFRLGMVCQYLELEVGIEYNRHQRDVQSIL